MPARLFTTVIPAQVVVTARKVDVFLVKDGSPLKRRPYTNELRLALEFGIHFAGKRFTVNLLACLAVAIFGIERFLPTELVLDSTTVTASFIPDMKFGIVFVYPIGSAKFPLIVFAF